MAFFFVGIDVALPLAGRRTVAVAVLQMLGDGACAFLFDLLHGLEVGPGAVGFGRGRQVERRFDQRVNAFGQADVIEGGCG